MGEGYEVPRFKRLCWPKVLPPLSEEQVRISDDFMLRWHRELPKFGLVELFNQSYPIRILPRKTRWRTLEVGAGTGSHLVYENLQNQDYSCLELRDNMAEELRRRFPEVSVHVGDVQNPLDFPDNTFGRIVAVHVLEHLQNLPAAIKELHRVTEPGGVFNIVVPLDPGLAYETARKISAERLFRRTYKMPYEWLIRREHLNSPQEIIFVLNQYFAEVDREYFPFPVPVHHANLSLGLTYVKRGTELNVRDISRKDWSTNWLRYRPRLKEQLQQMDA